jgi:hypothetical protein
MSGVCDNQKTYNVAFRKALKEYRKDKRPSRTMMITISIIHIIFIVWAVCLASRIQSGSERTKHLLFSLCFPQLYIIAYYVGNGGKIN